jgi:hypothetical protein
MGSLMALARRQAADTNTSQPPLIFIEEESIEYQWRVQQFCQDRCFFVTMKGYMGLGPKGMKPGDVLAVIAGSSTPYVLRPESDDFCTVGEGLVQIRREGYCVLPNGAVRTLVLRAKEERYCLQGEAYVHGLMYGEVWDLRGISMEDFRIV